MMNYKYKMPKKNNNKIIFLILFIVFVIVFTFVFKKSDIQILNKASSYITKPFEYVFLGARNISNNISDSFKNSSDLKEENDLLQSKINDLEYEVLEIEKLKEENISLKEMVDIKEEYKNLELQYAQIIYRDNDNFTDFFEINLGLNDNIKLNQPVIHKNGLVGYVSNVNDTSSTVTTILDPNSAVSVTISTINEPAVIKGDINLKASNKLKLEYIPIDTQISIGDILYTSGLSLKFPSKIPVGKIENIVNSKSDIDRYAVVTSSVDIFKISEVAVIMEN